MAGVITECAVLPLRPDVDIYDTSSLAGKVIKSISGILSLQPGFIAGHVGYRSNGRNEAEWLVGKSPTLHQRQRRRYRENGDEKQSKVTLFHVPCPLAESHFSHHPDWDSLESHQRFDQKLEIIDPMMRGFMQILRADTPVHHISYRDLSAPSNGKTTQASSVPASSYLAKTRPPVTEITTIFTPRQISVADMTALEAAWDKFLHDVVRKADGFLCAARGWVLEEMECPRLGKEKFKGFHAAVGWESAEKQKGFGGDSEAFTASLAFVKGSESYLVEFRPNSYWEDSEC